jgi:hypothetical protein
VRVPIIPLHFNSVEYYPRNYVSLISATQHSGQWEDLAETEFWHPHLNLPPSETVSQLLGGQRLLRDEKTFRHAKVTI